MRPLLSYQVQVLNPAGTAIWRGGTFVTNLDGRLPTALPEQLKDNAQLASDLLRAAAKLASDKFVQQFPKKAVANATR